MLETVISRSMNRRDFLKIATASSVFGCSGDGNGKRIFDAPSESPFSIFDYFPLAKGNKWIYNGWVNEVVSVSETDEGKEILYGPRKFPSKYEIFHVKGNELFLHGGITSYFDPDILIGNSNVDMGANFTTNFDLYVEGLAGLSDDGIITKFIKSGTGVTRFIYASLEDVEVPAGIFRNCLRVHLIRKESLFGGFIEGSSEDVYWLAKDIGRVKYSSSSLKRILELTDYEIS